MEVEVGTAEVAGAAEVEKTPEKRSAGIAEVAGAGGGGAGGGRRSSGGRRSRDRSGGRRSRDDGDLMCFLGMKIGGKYVILFLSS